MSVKIEAETESGVLRCMSPNYDCYFGLQILLLLPFFVQKYCCYRFSPDPRVFYYLWHCIASYVVVTFVDPNEMVVVIVSVVDVVFR